MNTTSKKTTLSLGFQAIDNLIIGEPNNALIVIASPPAMGKTTFMVSMVNCLCMKHNKTVLIISLGLSKKNLTHRIITNAYDTIYEQLKEEPSDYDAWENIVEQKFLTKHWSNASKRNLLNSKPKYPSYTAQTCKNDTMTHTINEILGLEDVNLPF